MGRKLMIEVDEGLQELLRNWHAASRAKTDELLVPNYDKARSDAVYQAEREAILRLALGVDMRIELALEEQRWAS